MSNAATIIPSVVFSNVIVPKRYLGICEGPDVEGLQALVTIAVELDDGTTLALAVPKIYLLIYRTEDTP